LAKQDDNVGSASEVCKTRPEFKSMAIGGQRSSDMMLRTTMSLVRDSFVDAARKIRKRIALAEQKVEAREELKKLGREQDEEKDDDERAKIEGKIQGLKKCIGPLQPADLEAMRRELEVEISTSKKIVERREAKEKEGKELKKAVDFRVRCDLAAGHKPYSVHEKAKKRKEPRSTANSSRC